MFLDGEILVFVELLGIDCLCLCFLEFGDGGFVYFFDFFNLSVNWLEWVGDDWIFLFVLMFWEVVLGVSCWVVVYVEMFSYFGMIMVVNCKQLGGVYMLFDGMFGLVGGISYILLDELDYVLMFVFGWNVMNFGWVNFCIGESESIVCGNEMMVNWIMFG